MPQGRKKTTRGRNVRATRVGMPDKPQRAPIPDLLPQQGAIAFTYDNGMYAFALDDASISYESADRPSWFIGDQMQTQAQIERWGRNDDTLLVALREAINYARTWRVSMVSFPDLTVVHDTPKFERPDLFAGL